MEARTCVLPSGQTFHFDLDTSASSVAAEDLVTLYPPAGEGERERSWRRLRDGEKLRGGEDALPPPIVTCRVTSVHAKGLVGGWTELLYPTSTSFSGEGACPLCTAT